MLRRIRILKYGAVSEISTAIRSIGGRKLGQGYGRSSPQPSQPTCSFSRCLQSQRRIPGFGATYPCNLDLRCGSVGFAQSRIIINVNRFSPACKTLPCAAKSQLICPRVSPELPAKLDVFEAVKAPCYEDIRLWHLRLQSDFFRVYENPVREVSLIKCIQRVKISYNMKYTK